MQTEVFQGLQAGTAVAAAVPYGYSRHGVPMHNFPAACSAGSGSVWKTETQSPIHYHGHRSSRERHLAEINVRKHTHTYTWPVYESVKCTMVNVEINVNVIATVMRIAASMFANALNTNRVMHECRLYHWQSLV